MMIDSERDADVVIIGAGPAGLSAALWCDELGLKSILIEQESSIGGQLRYIYNPIENYLGLASADGPEMLSRFEKSVGSRNFVRRLGIKVTSLDVQETAIVLNGAKDERLSASTVIIATGVRRRSLGIPGENHFRGKGIVESGSKDKQLLHGKKVLIIGGGDAAFENALIVADVAESVAVAYRRMQPTARPAFVEEVAKRPNIKLLPATVLTRIGGDSFVETAQLKDLSGVIRTEAADAILIRIGVVPNSELVEGILDRDEAGYIDVDHTGRTSCANVYAVGDVANRCSPTLSTAVGTAATAVKSIFDSIRS
jgi:thioredoxin reductase (NADPH)